MGVITQLETRLLQRSRVSVLTDGGCYLYILLELNLLDFSNQTQYRRRSK